MICGYSIAFTAGTPFIGGLGRAFLQGIVSDISKGIGNPNSLAPTIPETVYMFFQMTFAIITPALIAGALADRMKFSALLWFMGLWVILVYARSPTGCGADGCLGSPKRRGGQALDFAGGTVVHLNAGTAGLVAALMLGKRKGLGPAAQPGLTFIGASLLWVGWFGFNAGSAVTAGCRPAWRCRHPDRHRRRGAGLDVRRVASRGKPSVLGMCSGAVAGLVAITPASGFVGPGRRADHRHRRGRRLLFGRHRPEAHVRL